ncbi:MAG: DMT family transporter [Rhodoferax sp.]|jgi:drug/metabolite transporter (DMT)-like permease|nr:DMT family transporter [Rhodoferax sp.]MBP9929667.1 DMT family transporter [Rhodoferax sp.]HQZ05676.1 DMT family transporter [Burkholderiaceae bacterium]HRA61556.1 DMT family transporter [Burkholderiaceae bacterium]
MPLSSTPLLARPAIMFLLASFCCLLWGSAFPAVKLGYQLFGIARQDVASQMLFAGIRFVAAAALLLAGARAMGWRLGLARNQYRGVAILGLTQTALQYVFFYIGLANATGTKSSIMNATVTFFSVMLAHYLYRNDRLSHRRVLGCLVGFVGVAAANYGPTLLQPDFSWAGEGSIVLAALILAAASIYGKNLSQHINAVVMTGWQMLIGGVVLLAAGLLGGGQMATFTPASAALMAYMAVLSALAFGTWSALLKFNPVGRVAVFNFLTPVFGVALSALILGEDVLAWKNAMALVLVCAGIWLVTSEKRPAQSALPVQAPARAGA